MGRGRPGKTKMKINLIVCCDAAGGIGNGGGLPWKGHFPEDMANFTALTRGPPGGHNGVLMGRITWESLPARHRPLSGRRNYVVSSTIPLAELRETAPETSVYPSIEVAIAGAAMDNVRELWVMGGTSIYDTVLDKAELLNEIWVTTVHETYDADRFFPLEKVRALFPEGPLLETYCKTDDGIKYTISCYKRM
jgi:dihydrofolate reductase